MQSNEAAPLVHCAPASILLPHVAGYFRRPRGAFRSFFNDDHDDDVKNIARTIRFLCQSTNILGILKTVNVPNRGSGPLPLYAICILVLLESSGGRLDSHPDGLKN